ncbi:MAG: pantoate--beta-alanine ligase [Thermoanaerobaculales bacterium]|nr:pantoate--beta-alanine ligase [Thermoanaerobaculales bacterium]
MTTVLRNVPEMARWSAETRRLDLALGFVPTMGALHAGHFSLLERARRENDRVVVSLFVNPTQYDDPADLEEYPRTFEADMEMIESAGVDTVLFPKYKDLYPDDYRFRVTESPFSEELEGGAREGHFDGVLTVVLKLLNIVRPTRAYFGEKDWQQYVLVRDMAAAFFLETEIVACPVIREGDGLAMSSRNVHLTPEERRLAPEFHRILTGGENPEILRRRLKERGFDVDYVERRENRMLGAVRIGKVRLIDNVGI